MRAALLASVMCLLTALPLAASDPATSTPGTAAPLPQSSVTLPPVYLGTQSEPGLLSEAQIPRLHRVWRALAGRVRDGLDPQEPSVMPEEGIRDHLLQW